MRVPSQITQSLSECTQSKLTSFFYNNLQTTHDKQTVGLTMWYSERSVVIKVLLYLDRVLFELGFDISSSSSLYFSNNRWSLLLLRNWVWLMKN